MESPWWAWRQLDYKCGGRAKPECMRPHRRKQISHVGHNEGMASARGASQTWGLARMIWSELGTAANETMRWARCSFGSSRRQGAAAGFRLLAMMREGGRGSGGCLPHKVPHREGAPPLLALASVPNTSRPLPPLPQPTAARSPTLPLATASSFSSPYSPLQLSSSARSPSLP